MCRDEVQKAKAYLEQYLAKDMKGNRKGFCKYINSKRESRENMGSLLNGVREVVTNKMEKAKVLNAFFTSVFNGKTDLQESQNPET